MIGCHAFNRRLAVSSERRLTPGQTCKSGHCAGSTHLGLAVVADLHEKTAATNARPGDSGRACSQTSQVRGRSAIAKVIIDQLRDGRNYVGAPRLVMQSGQLALIISDVATSVARRSLHGWHAT